MKRKKRLNCYIYSNLIISFLSLNFFINTNSKTLVMKTSTNTLEKIYEKEEIKQGDIILSEEVVSNSVTSLASEQVNNYVPSYYVKPSYNSLTGYNLVNYAKNFLGLPYIYAGRSLATGTDCSGFTSLIYREFGIYLPPTVEGQSTMGSYVSREDIQPGDIIFYSYGSVPSHVAIYMGDGLIIHESNPRQGLIISSVNIMNYVMARRFITSDVVSNVSLNNQDVVENTIVNEDLTSNDEITLNLENLNEDNSIESDDNSIDNENLLINEDINTNNNQSEVVDELNLDTFKSIVNNESNDLDENVTNEIENTDLSTDLEITEQE